MSSAGREAQSLTKSAMSLEKSAGCSESKAQLLHLTNNRVGEFVRARRSANIARSYFAFTIDTEHCRLDGVCGHALFDVTQHQNRRLQERGRIRNSLTRNVRR